MKKTIDSYFLLFVCCAFGVLILGLGNYGLAETSEARYAEISREMFVSGDYLNPKLLGVFHFHKPPMVYYITTLGYRIFGVNEFGARFFLQVAIAVQLLLIYGMANLLFTDKKIAFVSGIIYFTMPIVIISSRNLTTDAFLTTFILASIYCWQYYTIKLKVLFLYLFYVFVGLALLTKGPVALLFILTYIIAYKYFFKKKSNINVHHIIGFLLCLTIGASWYLMVIADNPKLWDYFVEKQLVARMNSKAYNRSKPFWFYLPLIVGLLFPWWLGILPKLKSRFSQLSGMNQQNRLLLMAAFALFILFSMFSTKLIMYILPVFWMLAIFIASQLQTMPLVSRKIITIGFLSFSALLCAALVIFYGLDLESVHVSILPVIVGFLALVIALVVNFFIQDSHRLKPVLLAAVFSVSLLLISSQIFNKNNSLINSTKQIVDFTKSMSGDNKNTIFVYDYLLSSIPFYTDAEFITLKFNHDTTEREIQFQNDDSWKEHLWDMNDKQIVSKVNERFKYKNTYLFVRNAKDLDQEFYFLKENFKRKKMFPKWTIYYND
ncbi:MAG: ArnT family glycosyltransferase [Gelidibacter sp.]